MPTILRRSPFYLDGTTLRIPDGPAVEVQPEQIVVWVSIGQHGEATLPAPDHCFPALIDLGFNVYFLIREDHLRDWLKIQVDEAHFPFLGTMRISGEVVPTFEADVWLHPNVPGFRDQLAEVAPTRLEMDNGIAIFPATHGRYTLPLLGVSALRKNRLRLFVNGEKRYISVRAPFKQV